jgi:phytoene synthase
MSTHGRTTGRADVAWPGYAPWSETVIAAREAFIRVARSFWLIPELIPPVAREDIALLYAVCRELDDAIDEEPDRARARTALARWRAELRGQAPPRPLVAAFLAGVPRSGLPLACADHLLDGMEADLGEVRIGDDRSLLRYAYQVSAAVGLMLAPLLGVRAEAATCRVVDLGIALQLSNILVGVRGDAARGRVYLPAERLRAAGLTPEDVLADSGDPRLRPVLSDVAALARGYYRSAELGTPLVPLRYRHGVLLLSRVYGGLGRHATRSATPPETPAELPLLEKVVRLGEVIVRAWHPHVLGLLPAPAHDGRLHRALAGLPGVKV